LNDLAEILPYRLREERKIKRGFSDAEREISLKNLEKRLCLNSA
jgi:hypothetical protein